MTDHIHDLTTLDNATAYIITKTARHLRLHLQRFLRDEGIGPEQWYLLFRLYEQDGRSQKDLADGYANDFPNITRLVDALEKQGYVERQPDLEDRRRHRIYLTKNGRSFIESQFPKLIEVRTQVFGNISEAEIVQLCQTLQKIDKNLENNSLL